MTLRAGRKPAPLMEIETMKTQTVSKPVSDAVKAFAEVMKEYNEQRRQWVETFGNDEGFDEWFTQQIPKVQS